MNQSEWPPTSLSLEDFFLKSAKEQELRVGYEIESKDGAPHFVSKTEDSATDAAVVKLRPTKKGQGLVSKVSFLEKTPEMLLFYAQSLLKIKIDLDKSLENIQFLSLREIHKIFVNLLRRVHDYKPFSPLLFGPLWSKPEPEPEPELELEPRRDVPDDSTLAFEFFGLSFFAVALRVRDSLMRAELRHLPKERQESGLAKWRSEVTLVFAKVVEYAS